MLSGTECGRSEVLLDERAAHDATASISGGYLDISVGGTADAAVMRNVFAITTQAGVASIIYWRLARVVGIGKPVPVLHCLISEKARNLRGHRLTGWAPL